MFGGNEPQGFTIIETMIFLSVSALIFLSVLTLINGQQNKTDFSSGVKEFAAQIQNVAAQVQNGVFNNYGDFACFDRGTGSGGIDYPPGIDTPADYLSRFSHSSSEGSNSGCIAIGHLIQFYPLSFVDTSIQHQVPNDEIAVIYTVLGRQSTTNNVNRKTGVTFSGPVTTLSLAEPQIIHYNGTGANGSPDPLDTTILTLPPGLTYQDVYYNNNDGLGYQYDSLIGFYTGFPGGTGDTDISSGTPQDDLVPVPSNTGNASHSGTEFIPQSLVACDVLDEQNDGITNAVDDNLPANWVSKTVGLNNTCHSPSSSTTTYENPADGVTICLKSDGLPNTYGLITIGGNSVTTYGNHFNVQESTHVGSSCTT